MVSSLEMNRPLAGYCESLIFSYESTKINIPATSLLVCFLICFIYVGSLYLTPLVLGKLRIDVLWCKIIGTLSASLISMLIAWYMITIVPPPQPNCLGDLQILGISLNVDSVWWDGVFPLIITLVLLAPLMGANLLTSIFKQFVFKKVRMVDQLKWYFGSHLISQLKFYQPRVQQALIYGPLAEELTFRASMINILRITGGWSPWFSNMASSLLFSVAHAHDWIMTAVRTKSIPTDSLDILIQCMFTGAFGFFAGHIFIRGRCIWVCVLVHTICNAVGFPDIDLVLRLPANILLGLGILGGVSSAIGIHMLRLL